MEDLPASRFYLERLLHQYTSMRFIHGRQKSWASFPPSRFLLPSAVALGIGMASLVFGVRGAQGEAQLRPLKKISDRPGLTRRWVSAESVPAGSWGGNQLALTVSPKGATLMMDCAIAQIFQPIVVNERGEFSLTGQVRVEGGGPVDPATFEGTVSGDRMTLSVFYRDPKGQIENWQDELTFGHAGPTPPACPLGA